MSPTDTAVLSRAEHQIEADYSRECAQASLAEEGELYVKALDFVISKMRPEDRAEFIKQFFPDSWSDDIYPDQDEL